MKIEILRTSDNGVQTEGILYLFKDNKIIFECFTLELPWKDNKRQVSCIPIGKYRAIKHYSPRHKSSLWLQDVPNRSEILIHKGNYYTQLLGCILTGDKLIDINRDKQLDVTNSYNTLLDLLNHIEGNEIEIEIKYRV